MIVSASRDNLIRIWDAYTGKRIKVLVGHTDMVDFATFSKDGKYIFSCSFDNTIRKWELDKGNCVKIYDRYKYKSSHYGPSSLSIDPTGNHIAIAGNSNVVDIINLNDALFKTNHFDCMDQSIISVSYSIDGRGVMMTSDDSTLYVWEDFELPCANYRIYNPFNIMAGSISPDGNRILTIVGDDIVVFNVQTGNNDTLTGHTAGINCANFSPNGEFVVSASNDNTIRIWDLKSGVCMHVLEEYYEVSYALFTPDGHHIIASSNNYCLWDIEKESVIPLNLPNDGILMATSIVFSSDGKNMISFHHGDGQEWICIWDTKNWSCFKVIEEPEGDWSNNPIVVANPVFPYFASTIGNDTIKIWNVKTGNKIRSIVGSSFFSSLSFSPNGKSILATTNKSIFVYEFQPLQELIDQTRERFKDRPLTPEERRMYYLE